MSSKYSRGQDKLWEGHRGYSVEGRLLFFFFFKDAPSGHRTKPRCLRIWSKGLFAEQETSCLFLDKALWRPYVRSRRRICFSLANTGYTFDYQGSIRQEWRRSCHRNSSRLQAESRINYKMHTTGLGMLGGPQQDHRTEGKSKLQRPSASTCTMIASNK